MKNLFLGLFFVAVAGPLSAQVASTAVPFLNIGPDARGAGMGQVGAATSADVYSMYYNPAKYAFAEGKAAVGVSYAPWMRNLTDGLNLYSLNAFYRITPKQTVAISGRYFTTGDYTFMNNNGDEIGTSSTSDMAVDIAYSYLFGKNFSAALAARYIHSSLGDITLEDKVEGAGAFAADIALLYKRDAKVMGNSAHWGVGLNFSNLGTKMSYLPEGGKTSLPMNIRLGGSFDMDFCTNNNVMLALDLTKLLVDGPSGDSAPLVWALGAEYSWKKMIHVRAGYQDMGKDNGEVQLFTMGVGGSYYGVGLDVAYWMPMGNDDSPLKNTLKVSLSYRF